MNEEQIQLSDEVWQRVVVIIQEAMLTGVDCTDLLRQVRVQPGPDGNLVLTPAYKQMVADNYKKMLDEAAALQAEQDSRKFVGEG